MQGIQVASALNDENTCINAGPPTVSKENGGHGAAKQASALKTARKAFGNITNTQPREAGQPGTVKRRAFGADITNSTSKPTATAKKADAAQLKPSSQAAQVTVAEPATLPQPWWSTAQPEKSAGKSWERLQLDREREEDADVERTVQQLLAGMRGITARVFQVYIEDSDDEDALRLQPSICSLPDWTQDNKPTPATIVASDDGASPLLALFDDLPLDQLLPNVQLPDFELEPPLATAAAGGAAAVATSVAQQHAFSTPGDAYPSHGISSTSSSNCNNSNREADANGNAQLGMQTQPNNSSGNASCSPQRVTVCSVQPSHSLRSPEPLPW